MLHATQKLTEVVAQAIYCLTVTLVDVDDRNIEIKRSDRSVPCSPATYVYETGLLWSSNRLDASEMACGAL